MICQRSLPILLLLTAVLGELFIPTGSLAASPWTWVMTLKQPLAGDAIDRPTGLYIDPGKQHYYVVDSGKNRLLSFDARGKLLHILTAGRALKTPFSLTRVGGQGFWITEKGKNSLTYIDLKKREVVPHVLKDQGRLVYPDRIGTDGRLLYVLDKLTGAIITYNPDGLRPEIRYPCPAKGQGFSDFVIQGGKLWALAPDARTVYRFDLRGQREKTIQLGDGLAFPVSLAVGPSGYLYILDRHRRQVTVYDQHGVFKYRFLRQGIARAQLAFPILVRFDSQGRLCVVDEGNARVEIFRR